MEDTLRELRLFIHIMLHFLVLILVLMEDTLRGLDKPVRGYVGRLNPCSNGRYSQSAAAKSKRIIFWVLILVLMEDTLREG